MMFNPSLVPHTVEDLILEGSEEAALTALENQIQAQFKSIQEHMRDVEPIGASKANMADDSEPEDDEDAEDEDEEVMDDDSEDMSS